MSSFPSIRIEGGLLGSELLDQVIAADVPGQKPADFGLEPKRNLTDEIAAVFADSRALWGVFKNRLARLPEDDLATTVTRDQWALPFLALLGYQARYNPRAFEVDGQAFAVSHRAGEAEDSPPIHIVGARQELGRVPPSGRPRLAPHSLVQEYLNRTEHVWGIVTNGLTLRLLRDSTLVRRQAYVEFDLQAIFEEQRFHDFAALYRLLHRTRLPRGIADANECLLEKYYAQTIEQGGRVREHLRDGVEECLKLLGNGFLAHKDNEELRQKLNSKQLSPAQFYRQLFRIVYRFLFLLVSEDRGLISPNPVYRDHYGIARLRRMLDVKAAWTEHADLWLSLRTLFRLFQDDKLSAVLDLAPLNGELFAAQTLDSCTLSNSDLLHAFWYLAYYQERAAAPSRRVNYAALDVEELGSVYESLLEFRPDVARNASGLLHFDLIFGSERKTTGSFYTPPELVNELIESALMPVVQERLRQAGNQSKSREPAKASPSPPAAGGEGRGEVGHSAIVEKALLSLKIIDVACGSGHMLLAAARRVGKELAKLRTGEDEPAPERIRESVRDVISHCIYGVDRNPLAVDLCRVALWLESHTAGKPLTFLDHRIRCGDSLVGVFDLGVLAKGIPDKAFDPCEGDDKPTARTAAKKNREERRGAQDLFVIRDSGEAEVLTRHSRDVDAIPDDSPELIRRKKELFEASHRDPAWLRQKQACDLWTAAFFQTLAGDSVVITSAALADHLGGRPIDARFHGRATTLALGQPFFHWPLEFPEVFAEGGFDVVLSNPPWERPEFHEEQHWVDQPYVTHAANKADRLRRIEEYRCSSDPGKKQRFLLFEKTKHFSQAESKFLTAGERFLLSAVGKFNLYAPFAELARCLLNPNGRTGLILPTGVATEDTCKQFFGDLNGEQQLVSLFDFENREPLFASVHRSFKFCLFTISRMPVPRSELAFFLTKTNHIRDQRRNFVLLAEDFMLLTPNTRTCPVFRTRIDAELTKTIYRRVPVLSNESKALHPWGARPTRIFNMGLPEVIGKARTKPDLVAAGLTLTDENHFVGKSSTYYLPVYEGKMLQMYNHRAAGVEVRNRNAIRAAQPIESSMGQLQNASYLPESLYWIEKSELLKSQPSTYKRQWVIAYKDVTASTNERTMIATLLPHCVANFTVRIAFIFDFSAQLMACFFANLNSLVYDYLCRQALSGIHLSDYIIKQIPTLPPSSYTPADQTFVVPRVVELAYTAWDLRSFVADILKESSPTTWTQWFPQNSLTTGQPPTPFRWDEARRALLRAELDAWYARAYGLTRDELRYILDPADVHGPDFPGETFRVLKEKEQAKFGEYRTRRLVLEAWDKLPRDVKM